MGKNYGKLSGMMFLQYAVWGAWLPVLGKYLGSPVAADGTGGLGFTPTQVGLIFGFAASIGAVTSPFIGNLADRMFSTERCLATLMLVGGVVKWFTAYQTTYMSWLILSAVYSVIYMPTISLSNSLAFANIKNPDSEFPKVRVWGTIGWIAASWIFPWIFLQHDLKPTKFPPFLVGTEYPDATNRIHYALVMSGVVSIAYGLFCFFLPHTPPKTDVKELALTKAFGLFSRKSFVLLVAASLPISMIHQIYFLETGTFITSIGFSASMIGPILSIGQFFEIGVMAILGFMLAKMGFRWTIVVGGLAYFLRYAIFGAMEGTPGVIAAAQGLHGFCFSCFFAAGFIYVDRLAPEDIRHSAQTIFGIIILGVGPVAGGFLHGWLKPLCTDAAGVVDYSKFWFAQAAIGLVTTLVVAALFRDETQGRDAGLSKDIADEASEVGA